MLRFIEKFALRTIVAMGLISFVLSQALIVSAQTGTGDQPSNPMTPEGSLWVVDQPEEASSEEPADSVDALAMMDTSVELMANLPALKAVVFVGPIDGNTGPATMQAIASAQDTANVLRASGVSVQEFYPNNANATWANIKNAANGAHILVYRGHGVYWSAMPTPNVGGFALRDIFVSNDMIRNELRPAKNFIIMIYGCFSAGSASNDTSSISLDEARRRVAMYSAPFLEIGAGGYYTDWFDDAFGKYAASLLQGKTQRQAYEGYSDYNSAMIWRGTHPSSASNAMWLGWDNWSAVKPDYNNAFVGQPDATLSSLFGGSTSMTLSSTHVTYLARPSDSPHAFGVAVQSSSGASFTWTAQTQNAAWLVGVVSQGSSGQSLTFRIDPSKVSGSSSASIQVTSNTPGVQQATQTINVQVTVLNNLKQVYLSTVGR